MNAQIRNHGARINLKRAMEYLDETQILLANGTPQHMDLCERVQGAYGVLAAVALALSPVSMESALKATPSTN